MKSIRTLPLLLSLAFISSPLFAQDPTPTDSIVDVALRDLQDPSLQIEYRAQLATRLVMGGQARAVETLRELLRSDDTDEALRLVILTAVFQEPRSALLDDAIDVLVALPDPGPAIARLRLTFSAPLVKELSRRAADVAVPEKRRIEIVGLLGKSGTKLVVAPLLELWQAGEGAVAKAAGDALYLVVPIRFETPAAAADFWEKNGHRDLHSILWELAYRAGNGRQSDLEKRRYEEFARSVLDQVTLTVLLTTYVKSPQPEVRRMGAERLSEYPYGREGPGEAQARTKVATEVLGALDAEDDPGVEIALLKALRALAASAKEVDSERTLAAATGRLDSGRKETRLAALAALVSINDKRSVEVLCRRYDALGVNDVEFRLAILDAIERIGDGIARWVNDKLKLGDPEEQITIRLLQLLKRHEDFVECVPTLIGFLSENGSGSVRQEVASALGIIGVSADLPAAIDALAEHGLSDEDSSVRVIAATQIGRASRVEDGVIERLRVRLGETETVPRVRIAVARSLLRHRGEVAVPWFESHLADDAFWRDAVRSYLTADILGAGRAAEAFAIVDALFKVSAWSRCVEAGRLSLAKEMEWPVTTKGEVVYRVAASHAGLGQGQEGLTVLTAFSDLLSGPLASDPTGMERALVRAKLLRLAGAPADGIAALAPIFGSESPPEGIVSRATMEKARSQSALGEHAKALETVRPLLADPAVGKEAQAVEEEIRKAQADASKPPSSAPGAAAASSAATSPAAATLLADLATKGAAKRKSAVATLKAMGAEANPVLLTWLAKLGPAEVPAALKVVAEVTGKTVAYDPAAPAAERKRALAELRTLLEP